MAVYVIELDGSLTRIIDDLETPNGILITPDDATLYLVDHNPDPGGARTLVEYTRTDSGDWQRGRTLADFGDGYGGDGMVLDIEGNIYLTAGSGDLAGVHIFDPDGEQTRLHPHRRNPRQLHLWRPGPAHALHRRDVHRSTESNSTFPANWSIRRAPRPKDHRNGKNPAGH